MPITAETLFLIASLSIVVRYLVDTIGCPLVVYYKLPSVFKAVIALLVGEALAFGLQVSLLQNGLAPWADQAVMGVLVAGGGGLLHDFLKALGYVRSQHSH